MKSSSALVSHLIVSSVVALGAFVLDASDAAAAVACGAGMRPAIGGGCVDIDECLEGTDTCSADELCVNRAGTFSCTCDEGFRPGIGGGCVDIDECAEGTDSCGQDEVCTNRAGTFTCACGEGFRDAVGGGCVDIDECAEGTDSCGQDEICTNRAGTFTCACSEGFREAVGGGCVDVDECAEGTDTCLDDQVCTNRMGTFTCAKTKPSKPAIPKAAPPAKSKSAVVKSASQALETDTDGDDSEIEEGGLLCSAVPGGADPSAIAMLVGIGAVLVSRRRKS